jgi:hypothetical protein
MLKTLCANFCSRVPYNRVSKYVLQTSNETLTSSYITSAIVSATLPPHMSPDSQNNVDQLWLASFFHSPERTYKVMMRCVSGCYRPFPIILQRPKMLIEPSEQRTEEHMDKVEHLSRLYVQVSFPAANHTAVDDTPVRWDRILRQDRILAEPHGPPTWHSLASLHASRSGSISV